MDIPIFVFVSIPFTMHHIKYIICQETLIQNMLCLVVSNPINKRMMALQCIQAADQISPNA